MTQVAVRDEHTSNGAVVPAGVQDSPLVLWAYQARQAHQIAQSLAKTSFVPATMKGKPDDITAAILAGDELGLKPMAALRSMDIIQGTPALRAHAMRALVQSRGHSVQVTDSTETRCVVRGRRAGEDEWQTVTWTIARATKLGLTGKPEWRKQPQTMLVARATGEICRLIAADALHAMPYTVEELGDDVPSPALPDAPTTGGPARRTAQRRPLPPAPEPQLDDDEFAPPDEAPPEREPTGDDPPQLQLDDDWPATAPVPQDPA